MASAEDSTNFSFHHFQRSSTGHPGDTRHPCESDRKNDQPKPRTKHGHEKQHEHDVRERENDVHRSHQYAVGARRVRREEPNRDAQQHAERCAGQRHPDDGTASVQHWSESTSRPR